MHGVGLLQGEEVQVRGDDGHRVGLDPQVEEKPHDVDVLGQVVPRLAGREVWRRSHITFLFLGESGVQGVLVELGHLLQGDGSEDGLGVRRGMCRL